MLDAASRRIAAVTRQQIDQYDASAPRGAPPEETPALITGRAPAADSAHSKTVAPILPVVAPGAATSPAASEARSGKVDASPAQKPSAPVQPSPTPVRQPPPPAHQPREPAAGQSKEKTPDESSPAADQAKETVIDEPAPISTAATVLAAAVPVSQSEPDDEAPLEISELRLCRSVSGFGSFEPLTETSVNAGQTVLIYCEMAGMRYEPRNEGFVSRISSRIEIRAAGDGPIQWEHDLGDAEDVCRRRRHDFYVNYRVDLPASLPPGAYDLRLTQTDLIANSVAAAVIPLVLTP
jgi:hypothetical protein